MYDAGKIIPGLIIFLCLITFPGWYSLVKGEGIYVVEPEIVTEGEQCVESAEYMRANHMYLLIDDWRETVVREGIRTYVSSDGKEYNMSLTETCMDCHSNRAEFCDKCHDYVGGKPNCWDCHNEPGGD